MKKSILITLLLTLVSLQYSNAQAHVQTATLFQNSTSNTIVLPFTITSTAKNLIIVHLDWDKQSRSVSSVNDSKGNIYYRINGPTNWTDLITGPNYGMLIILQAAPQPLPLNLQVIQPAFSKFTSANIQELCGLLIRWINSPLRLAAQTLSAVAPKPSLITMN